MVRVKYKVMAMVWIVVVFEVVSGGRYCPG